MGLRPSRSTAEIKDNNKMMRMMIKYNNNDHDEEEEDDDHRKVGSSSSSDPTVDMTPRQLDLIPFSPIPRLPCSSTLRLPWLSDNLSSEPGSSDGHGPGSRIMELNRRQPVVPVDGDADEQSSPNSGTSSFMEFSLYTRGNNHNNRRKKRENDNNGNNNNEGENKEEGVNEGGGGATTSRGSDDEENGSTRKKLRLSKEQSAFLEESFKEHHTLNPVSQLLQLS
ncbi:hypothetical protein KSS87_012328 [Heliosperma pusillum]|nr:hypothetical protein KSS87_012328 [Heliosperma pusillum]